MKFGDAVGPLTEPQPEHSHVVARRVTAGIGLGPKGHDVLQRQPGSEVRELVLDEALVETIDSRRHGGVGGENGSCSGQFDGGGQVAPVGQVLPNALETEEPCMALITVVDIGPRMTGDLTVAAQRPDTADTEDDLLRKA